MTNPIARQPKGIPTGGQFAATAHSVPDVTLAADDGRSDAAKIIESNAQPAYLRYVHYDDRLTDDQIEMLLSGQWSDAENAVDDAFAEGADMYAEELVEQEINEAYEAGRIDREWHELDTEEQEEARAALHDRDQSDPLNDLIRNTPRQLMRTSMGQPIAHLADRDAVWGNRMDDGGLEHRRVAIATLLADSGLDASTPEAQVAITELIENGPWDWHEGVQLDVIFYGEIQDVLPATSSDADPDARKSRELEFADPHVLLIDKWNGSGHDLRIPGTLKRALGRPEEGRELGQTQRVYLDSKAGGYSWDDVCGLHKPAYADGAPKTSWV